MPAHTHDGIDWVARLADLRQADAANAPSLRAVAERLIESLPAPRPTVIDVGCGAGGMSAALAAALAGRAARAAGPTTGTLETAANTRADAHPWTGIQPAVDATEANSPATGPRDGGHMVADAPTEASTTSTGDQLAGGVGAAGSVGGDSAGDGDQAADRVSAAGSGGVGGNPGDDQRSGDSAGMRGAGLSGGDFPGDAGRSLVRNLPAGGTLVLVDMVPELLAAAEEGVAAAAGVDGAVRVLTMLADVADPDQFGRLPEADLVWAANVTHHLPDQRQAIATLVRRLAPGGCLALSEGGLSMRCLPWDVGVGEPGLQDRLVAAQTAWFHRMRTEMPGAVRMPIGWNQALTEAGLSGVTAFSYLLDVPAPLSDAGRDAVVSWLAWMTRATADLLDPADTAALHRLLDPADPAYVSRRDDVFMLKASTVYLGWR